MVIEGASGLLVRIAKCCNPVPGDDIVGYITKGRGVAIHRMDCMNLRAQENYEQRLLDVEWEDQFSSKEYTAHIDIYGLNRTRPVVRVDRDSTAHKNDWADLYRRIADNEIDILVDEEFW